MLRNLCILDLNGESGDDSFTVRSFLAPTLLENGTKVYEAEEVKLRGGFTSNKNGSAISDEADEGDDNFQISTPEEVPDYLVNSLVDIDGGTGTNRLTIVGTEAGCVWQLISFSVYF